MRLGIKEAETLWGRVYWLGWENLAIRLPPPWSSHLHPDHPGAQTSVTLQSRSLPEREVSYLSSTREASQHTALGSLARVVEGSLSAGINAATELSNTARVTRQTVVPTAMNFYRLGWLGATV